MAASYRVSPGGSLGGQVCVPGDKSISHRALMLASIAEGDSRLTGFLPGEDTLATQQALAAMGVNFDSVSRTEVIVHGAGLHGLKSPGAPLYLGNSGTSTRLLSGLLSGAGIDCEITGDDSLTRRPMGRVIEPLRQMGADIQGSAGHTLPITIRKVKHLHGIHYRLPVASAQLKSCLLLAGLFADDDTCIEQPAPCRDHTERMLTAFGAEVSIDNGRICLRPGHPLRAVDVQIPADISSAAFFIVGALIAPGSEIVLPGVGVNPTRNAVLAILQAMGGHIRLSNERQVSGEPVADIHVGASQLRGIDIPAELVPNAIDEFPAIFIAAAAARGSTCLRGAAELRVKESDRIAAMSAGLGRLGIATEEFPDGLRIEGGKIGSGTINSHGDHRVAMAFAMAGLAAGGPVIVEACDNVATSFPDFAGLSRKAGLTIEVTGT